MSDWSEWTSCQMYGHRYTIDPDPEVYSSCVDCGEPRDTDEDEDTA